MTYTSQSFSLAGCLVEGLVKVCNNILRALQSHAHLFRWLCTHALNICMSTWPFTSYSTVYKGCKGFEETIGNFQWLFENTIDGFTMIFYLATIAFQWFRCWPWQINTISWMQFSSITVRVYPHPKTFLLPCWKHFYDFFSSEYDSLISKTDFTSLWRGWKIHFWYASEDLFYANFMLPKPSRIYKIHNINFYKREWPPPPFISFIKKQEKWYGMPSLSLLILM